MVENANKEAYSDEIDLYELILVFKKRIRYIVSVFVIGIAIAALISFLMPNIYQARATLWVDSFLTQAMIKNLKANQSVKDGRLSFIIPLQQNRPSDVNNLSLSILKSVEFQKKVSNKIRQTYGLIDIPPFKADIDKKTGSIVLTSEQRERKFGELILQTAIEEFSKELDKASLAYSEVLASEKVRSDKSKNFVLYVVENPNSSETPVKPKRMLIIAVSAISSLFAGIFLAFLVEWWSKAKRD
ncbi:hypothetical protein JZK55_12030 [Dissulfurispira thermophila]|uniref:Polysaccharide chain length determinant N-terminal domain-containing protein n=2 Tax=root TaxID=1 RepID=A0A7G1H2C2_9BACT|nr:Wzz/FepE/Etk N-terminal domain-containing protein [Dissulfurispira thermophila]BCB96281.1 hypothetical protein JZK55_12030 [Dissulfurispira thermophila]